MRSEETFNEIFAVVGEEKALIKGTFSQIIFKKDDINSDMTLVEIVNYYLKYIV